jgi:hypothetical protein
VELEAVKTAIDRMEAMLQKLIDREESRISRISEIAMDAEKMRGDCRACRERTEARLTDGNSRFADHDGRIKALEDPETGAVRRGQAGKARDGFIQWVELGKAILFIVAASGVIYATLIKKG